MNGLRFLFIIMLVAGCSSVAQKQNAALSKGIFAEDAALKAGRYDLASKYSQQVTKLLPPPKKAIAVNPFIVKGKKYVVLPADAANAPVMVEGSQPYNLALAGSKQLQGQQSAENRALNSFANQTGDVLRAKEKEVEKAEQPKSFLSKIFSFFKWGGIFGTIAIIIAGVVIAIFFPELLPVFFEVVKGIFDVVVKAVNGVITGVKELIAKYKK